MAHLPCLSASFSSSTSKATDASAKFDRFTALMRFQVLQPAQRRWACCQFDADRHAQKPGLMMASIYRTLAKSVRELPGAAPAHQSHATAQGWLEDAYNWAACKRSMQVAIIGGGWAGMALPL